MNLRRQGALALICISLILGAITDTLVRQEIFGLNFVLWSLVWLSIGLAIAIYKKKASLQILVYALFIVVNCVLVYVRSEPLVMFWSVGQVLVFMTLMYARLLIDNFSELSLLNRLFEFIAGTVTTSVHSISHTVSVLSKSKGSRTPLKLSNGVIVAVPLAMLFIALFSSSDKIFGNGFAWLGDWLSSFARVFDNFNLGKFVSIVFWSVLSFTGVALALRSKYVSHLQSVRVGKALNIKDSQIITGSVSVVFGLFIAVQVKYLFTGGSLPAGFTYADYARRGYGELLFATMLASAVVFIVRSSTKSVSKLSSTLDMVLLSLNAVVVLTAWKRLSLYESAYGWTMARFVARMGLVCILLGIVSLSVWILGKLSTRQLFTANWYALAIVLTVAAIANPVGLITARNINERDSREVALDTDYIISQSADSLPAICKYARNLEANHPEEFVILKDRKQVFYTNDGQEISTSYLPSVQDVIQHNRGLSAHNTKSKSYINKYTYCLQN